MQNNVSYFRQVVLKVPGLPGGNKATEFTFDDQPDLRYARTTGLCILTASDLAFALPEPVPVLPDAQLNLVSFRFETNDPDDLPNPALQGKRSKGDAGRFSGTLETIQYLPASLIHVSQFGATTSPSFVRNMLHFKNDYIIWQKSKVQVGTGGLNNTTDVAIVLGVFYTFTTLEGKMIYPRN